MQTEKIKQVKPVQVEVGGRIFDHRTGWSTITGFREDGTIEAIRDEVVCWAELEKKNAD